MSGVAELRIALAMFAHFSLLSMMAIGGGIIALLPEMHRIAVDTQHWLSNAAFVQDIALAQIAPGPNMLFVTLIGLDAAGLPGALGATAGIIVPPALLTVLLLRLRRARGESDSLQGLRRVFVPLSIGMVSATAWSLGVMTVAGGRDLLLLGCSVALLTRTRIHPLWLIGVGALLGIGGLV